MAEAGRDLWLLLDQQGHPVQVAQDHVYLKPLKKPKEVDLTTSQGNMCQCSVSYTVKK